MRARRVDPVDHLVRDGESVALVGRRVVRLSPLATALLAACTGWEDAPTLAARLEARFGAPPAGSSLAATEAALRDLRDEGLVELG